MGLRRRGIDSFPESGGAEAGGVYRNRCRRIWTDGGGWRFFAMVSKSSCVTMRQSSQLVEEAEDMDGLLTWESITYFAGSFHHG